MALGYDIAVGSDVVKWVSINKLKPESPYGCLVIIWDENPMTGDMFLNYLPYFVGWDGEQWNNENGERIPFEVAYWMKLPEIPKYAEDEI